MYPSDDLLKKYLLKLWIKRRLEEIRKNSTLSTSQSPSSSSTTLAPLTSPSPSLCPDIYSQAPESGLLCQLWAELESLKTGDPTPPPGSHPGLSPLLVLCPYSDHSSGLLLCQLWCEIQTFYNKVSTQLTSRVSDNFR